MKVLVTGAKGFLGRAVVKHLIILGYDVYGLSRNNQTQPIGNQNLTWVTADLFSYQEINLLMEKYQFEGLVHLAWDTTHDSYWHTNDNLKWVALSLNLFESFRVNGGKRLLVAGSSAEYQWGVDSVLDENSTPKLPASIYGVSKAALHSILQTWAEQNNVSWGWAYLFNIFGPHEKPERLIPRCINDLLNKKKILFDSGLLYRDFMHVTDAGSAFATFFKSNVEGAVNIASGKSTSVRFILETLAEIMDTSDLIDFNAAGNKNDSPISLVASVDKLSNEVNWSTNVSLLARLVETCDWWKNKTSRG